MKLLHPSRKRFNQASARSSSRKPALEILEDRTLLSATLVLSGPQTLVPLANVNASNIATVDMSEMTVSVNPANPLNLAGFSHYIRPNSNYDQIGVFYSMDGGNSWTTTLIGGTGSVNSDGLGSSTSNVRFDPTIKFDHTGNLYVGYGAYTASSGFTKLIIGTSTDGGASFANSTFHVIDSQSGYGGVDKFYLATGPAGPGATTDAVYIAYDLPFVGNPVYVAGSNDGGNTYTAPTQVRSGGGGNSFSGPAVGPNGELYVLWVSLNDNALEVRVKPDGLWGSGGWNPISTVRHLTQTIFLFPVPPQPRRGITNGPSIDVDRSGDAFTGRTYVAFVDKIDGNNNFGVFLAYSDDTGTTWSSAGTTGNVDDAAATAFHSWVAVDQSSGSVNVLYRTNEAQASTDKCGTWVASSNDGGTTFTKIGLASQSSRAGAATYSGDFLDYSGFDVVDGTMHGFWSDNRGASEGTYTSNLAAYTAMAGYQSATGANTLYVNGDDNGPTDDTIIVRQDPANADFLDVIVNGQMQYAGLALSVNNLVINGLEGNNTIVIQSAFPTISITVTVGSGRNLMIAGNNAATLNGGGGDNILIGGTTQFDTDPVALAAVMAEWTRTDEDYATRVDHILNGGGLNDPYLLNASTVTGNGLGNNLLGNGGLNLYFGDLGLDNTDWDPLSEVFVSV
jgi:hypothetical protein